MNAAKEALLRAVGLGDMVDAVKAGKCPSCKTSTKDAAFRDGLSLKEFNISGLCQKCQDEHFTEPH